MNVYFTFNGASFVWDVVKARNNEDKHGIRFEQAVEVFFDPFLRLVDASRHEEERDAVIGYSAQGSLLFVVHVLQEAETLRLISARKASLEERKIYDS